MPTRTRTMRQTGSYGRLANDKTARCGRPSASALETDVARPHSLQWFCWAGTSSSRWPLKNDQRLLSLPLRPWYQRCGMDGETLLRCGIKLVLEIRKTALVSDTSDKSIFASSPAAARGSGAAQQTSTGGDYKESQSKHCFHKVVEHVDRLKVAAQQLFNRPSVCILSLPHLTPKPFHTISLPPNRRLSQPHIPATQHPAPLSGGGQIE